MFLGSRTPRRPPVRDRRRRWKQWSEQGPTRAVQGRHHPDGLGIGRVSTLAKRQMKRHDHVFCPTTGRGREATTSVPRREGNGSAYEASMRVPALVVEERIGRGSSSVRRCTWSTSPRRCLSPAQVLPLDGQNLWKYLTGRKDVGARAAARHQPEAPGRPLRRLEAHPAASRPRRSRRRPAERPAR